MYSLSSKWQLYKNDAYLLTYLHFVPATFPISDVFLGSREHRTLLTALHNQGNIKTIVISSTYYPTPTYPDASNPRSCFIAVELVILALHSIMH